MHKKLGLILLFIITIFLSGCWDRREPENLGLVQAIGLDLNPKGKGIVVTTMIAIPQKLKSGGGSSGGGDSDTGTFLISMEAPTIYEAFNRINTTVNREITLLQNTVLIISDDIAKQGLKDWIDNLVRFREMRRTLSIIICQGKAAEILNVKPRLEKNPTEYFRDLLELSKRNGMYPITTLNDFLNRYEDYAQSNYAPLIAKYQPAEGEVPGQSDEKKQGQGGGSSDKDSKKPSNQEARFVGTAIFKKDKMIGSLDQYESQALLMVTNRFHEAILSLPDPLKHDSYVVFRLISSTPPSIQYRHSTGADRFQVNFKMEADILSIQSTINYTTPKSFHFRCGIVDSALNT